jgi:hypothetical protein
MLCLAQHHKDPYAELLKCGLLQPMGSTPSAGTDRTPCICRQPLKSHSGQPVSCLESMQGVFGFSGIHRILGIRVFH